MLLVAGYLTGLRSGADSQANLVDDLVRRNKLLGDQNRDLVEVNQELLRTRQDCESDAIQSTPTE
ncbi:MAG: hypothetical protein CMJ58_24595 [Planctomycetaceae bacterium]|nr:hypothetical protein [Planctomycetaceae bacterium]